MVVRLDGVTLVPEDDSDSPTAVTPGLAAPGPIPVAADGTVAAAAAAAGAAAADGGAVDPTALEPIAGAVPVGVRISVVAVLEGARTPVDPEPIGVPATAAFGYPPAAGVDRPPTPMAPPITPPTPVPAGGPEGVPSVVGTDGWPVAVVEICARAWAALSRHPAIIRISRRRISDQI
jgi:hypothetical protein